MLLCRGNCVIRFWRKGTARNEVLVCQVHVPERTLAEYFREISDMFLMRSFHTYLVIALDSPGQIRSLGRFITRAPLPPPIYFPRRPELKLSTPSRVKLGSSAAARALSSTSQSVQYRCVRALIAIAPMNGCSSMNGGMGTASTTGV